MDSIFARDHLSESITSYFPVSSSIKAYADGPDQKKREDACLRRMPFDN